MASDRAAHTEAELDRKLAHVLDRRMRLVLVRDELLASPPEDACAWLAAALDRAPGARGTADRLREAIVEVLTCAAPTETPGDLDPLPYETRRALYAAAVATGAERLGALLRTHPHGGAAPTGARTLPRELEEIPLGRRRSLAKGDDRLMLEKLALDPDPTVIANLLRNPRLRESEIVRIAALRTVPPSTLEEIAAAERWSNRLAVRTALARNPNCPVVLAIRLIGGLPLSALKALRTDPGLPDETMSHVDAELVRRADSVV
jgi:hypothetical protein